MRINVDLPHAALYPNRRSPGAWRSKATATKEYRHHAKIMARIALGPYDKPKWNRAHVKVTVFHPSSRNYHDPDNMLAALKAVWDGFQDADLLYTDRHLSFGMLEQHVDADKPRVQIEITEGAPPSKENSDE